MKENEYQSYTHTDYYLRKKNKNGDSPLCLSTFRNNTLNIETPIKPSMVGESIFDYLNEHDLIDKKTGEIIIQWYEDKITYLSDDYKITMVQRHESTNNQEEIKQHNLYILNRIYKG